MAARGVLKRYRRSLERSLRVLLSDKAGIAGLAILLFFVCMAAFGPMVVPYDPKGDPAKVYLPPSLEHPLGTDFQGRDVLSQVVHGSRSVLVVAFLTGFLTTVIAMVIGFISGYVGGWVDTALMSLADFILTIPTIPLFTVLAALIRLTDVTYLSIMLASVSWPTLARALRSQVLSIKERDFIEAARALGFNAFEVVFGEVMPNLLPYIVVSMVFASINAIYAQVSLAYLGLVPFVGENWGIMLNRAWTFGAIFYPGSLFFILSPMIAIVLLQLGLIWTARAVEILLNPRLRGE